MKFEMTFSTIARCSVYNVDSGDFVGKVDINLILREEDCTSFLFRFAKPIFKIGDFNVILRFDSLNVLEGIVFRKDFVEAHPDVVAKFIQGTLMAADMYDTEFDSIRKVMPMFSTASDEDIVANWIPDWPV